MRDLLLSPLMFTRPMTDKEWRELMARQQRSLKRIKHGRSVARKSTASSKVINGSARLNWARPVAMFE